MTEAITLVKYMVYGAGVAGLYWFLFKPNPIAGFLITVGLLSW